MSGMLDGRELSYRVRRSVWLAAVSAVHPPFDSKIRSLVPASDLSVLVLCIYRHENARILLRHVAAAIRCRWEVRLWALDQVHPRLAHYSLGAGKGPKMALLNSLIGAQAWSDFDWILIIDDDFQLYRGSLSLFLGLAQAAGLSLAQPAHTFSRHRSFRVNCCHPLSVARLTTFVETGPAFAVNRTWAKRIFPFPDGMGMGWGLDVIWSDLRNDGALLGVIDWVALTHLKPAWQAYDDSPERQRVRTILQKRGYNSIQEMQKTLAVWRPWQRQAPWVV